MQKEHEEGEDIKVLYQVEWMNSAAKTYRIASCMTYNRELIPSGTNKNRIYNPYSSGPTTPANPHDLFYYLQYSTTPSESFGKQFTSITTALADLHKGGRKENSCNAIT